MSGYGNQNRLDIDGNQPIIGEDMYAEFANMIARLMPRWLDEDTE